MLRCSKEAFAKCPTRHLCGSPEEATFAENSECARFNAKILELPMTNGDRIRCMSNEELAEFIRKPFCDRRTHEECKLSYCGVCEVCVLDWLKEPAEEVSTK